MSVKKSIVKDTKRVNTCNKTNADAHDKIHIDLRQTRARKNSVQMQIN